MDKGAHFHKTDFQVHTPRDPGWVGAKPVNNTERIEYAKQFVRACRERSIQAVAITDHHDLTFFPYIRDAAEAEVSDEGLPIPIEKRLLVFPGIELTLAIPCQALLIFDATLPNTVIGSILPHFGITPVAESEPSGPQATRLVSMTSFQVLYDRLNENANLKGRFIVLPHVQDGGHETLLRSGFSEHYKKMPCVGGYVDGAITKFGAGNLRILDGKDGNYGNKALGVFQTSDSRREDFKTLGAYCSWVKWATPTAEAIRQACLSKQSRISHTEPQFPTIRIKSIEVSDSAFLGRIENLELNPQFNALIGGRGTGKSSLLEYIRWALCDQPVSVRDEESGDIPNYARKRDLLITNTLTAKGGTVIVNCELNGVQHSVRRETRQGTIWLRIGTGSWREVGEAEIREKIPIQGYSQKQLSTVSVLPAEIQRLVTAEIQAESDALSSRLHLLADNIRQLSAQESRKKNLEKELAKEKTQAESLRAQAETLRKGLKGLSEDEQKILKQEPLYSQEESLIAQIEQNLATGTLLLHHLVDQLDTLSLDEQPLIDELPDRAHLDILVKEYSTALTKLKALVHQQAPSILAPSEEVSVSQEFTTTVKALRDRIQVYRTQYAAAKSKSTSHKSALDELERIEKSLLAMSKAIAGKSATIAGLGNPTEALQAMWAQWRELHFKRSALVQEQCGKLQDLSGGQFRARVKAFGDPNPIVAALENAFLKKNIRKSEEKIEGVEKLITNDKSPFDKWNEVIKELEGLVDTKGSNPLPGTPLLDSVGLTRDNRESLREGLTRDEVLELRLALLNDLPIFEFKTGVDTYIDFDNASAGQQATALLRILLNQEGPPLLIDQPEEDLDNEIIQDIATSLWTTKSKRQLVFVSHNANIVVNGDAELVVVFDYRNIEDPSSGHIKSQGAIDVPEIRECIKKVMEGGEEAFELRRKKYGF